MPGRISTRTRESMTTSGLSNKASSQTLNNRQSNSSRVSSPAVTIPEDGPSSNVRIQVCAIFGDAQRTIAGHRKLAVNLRKVQERCCYEPVRIKPKKGEFQEEDGMGEEDFNAEVLRCTLRLLGVKKSETAADRVIRFLGLFLKHASDKDISLLPQPPSEEDVYPETPSTHLTTLLLSTILPFLNSKEKTVRYRTTQIVSHTINTLDSIDDDLFYLLRLSLLKRLHDKEPMVRVQAVLGLGRLAGNEADDDEREDSDFSMSSDHGSGLLERLLEVLQNDPSADVRRSLLLNLPLTPGTLPFLLERARDQDPATRRALYSRLLPALGDFRHLSLSMREKLLRWGLRDRDENVRKAAGKLFRERWIEDCAGTLAATENDGSKPKEGEAQPPNFEGLLELLERIDVVNSGVENGVALEAMKGFWEGRADYRNAVVFDQEFWGSLTAESVFMARSFNSFCRDAGEHGKYDDLVDEKMPEVTALAFYLERYVAALMTSLAAAKNPPAEGAEEDVDPVEAEFIVEQLLHIASTLDYSDEVGRRKMFTLLRETLAMPDLPDEVTRLVVSVLRDVCGGTEDAEREFCAVVLEAVAEVHDTIMDPEADAEGGEDESFHSARSELSITPTKASMPSKKAPKGGLEGEAEEDPDAAADAKAIKEILVNLKCLLIAQATLSHVYTPLQSNPSLLNLLNNLIIPAVRSHEAPIREAGLRCLGLCCLLDRSLAEENLGLFLHCWAKGSEALQEEVLGVVADLLLSHGPGLLAGGSATATTATPGAKEVPAVARQVSKMYTRALRSASVDVAGMAAIALCKLLLSQVLRESELLKQLIVAYFDPETKGNLRLRQALSYALPVFSHSRKENMRRVGEVVGGVVRGVVSRWEEDGGEEGEEGVNWGVLGGVLAEWTDERRGVWNVEKLGGMSLTEGDRDADKDAEEANVHLTLALDTLERLNEKGLGKEERKTLASLLSKLHLAPNNPPAALLALQTLLEESLASRVFSDAAGRNALLKLNASVAKILAAKGVAEVKGAQHAKEGEEEEGVGEEIEEVATEMEEQVGKDDGQEGVGETDRLSTERDVADSLVDELLSDGEDETGGF